jgi:cation:H+ antiporter
MTTLKEDLSDVHPRRQQLSMAVAMLVTAPGLFVRFVHTELPEPVMALLFGLAIVGAAFILSWAAEAAQLDVSAGLAIALLAFIAVLPEYAVDMVFAFKAGNAVQEFGSDCRAMADPSASPCSLALANMTGANRLLIGIGWSMVVFIAWFRWRGRGSKMRVIELERSHAVELSFLTVATAYSLTLPLKGTVTIVDAVILVGIFVLYTIRLSTAPAEDPHLVGPARYLGTFPKAGRRSAVVGMFVFAAAVILSVAERFAEALVATGEQLELNEFLLVQWVAPLASEAPELLVAGLYAWRLNTNAGLGTLVSSKVNQWTLLVGTLPVVFAIASGTLGGLPVDATQREEILLTASQSVFAVAVLSTLSISVREALMLFALFWAQFVIGALVPESVHGIERVVVSIVYLVLGAYMFFRGRHGLPRLLRDGFRTPHEELRGKISTG